MVLPLCCQPATGGHVTGIDLTREYVETGNTLCKWVGLERVFLQEGSALAMPFAERSFDGTYMLHVGMNIEDKEKLRTRLPVYCDRGRSLALMM